LGLDGTPVYAADLRRILRPQRVAREDLDVHAPLLARAPDAASPATLPRAHAVLDLSRRHAPAEPALDRPPARAPALAEQLATHEAQRASPLGRARRRPTRRTPRRPAPRVRPQLERAQTHTEQIGEVAPLTP